MALSKEDKKDVSSKLGKALANKVEKVTRDKSAMRRIDDETRRRQRAIAEYKDALSALKASSSAYSSKSQALAKKSK